MNLQPQLDVITLAYVNQRRRRRRHAFEACVCDVEHPLVWTTWKPGLLTSSHIDAGNITHGSRTTGT